MPFGLAWGAIIAIKAVAVPVGYGLGWGTSKIALAVKDCEKRAKDYLFEIGADGSHTPKRFIPAALDVVATDTAADFLRKTAKTTKECEGEKSLDHLALFDLDAYAIKDKESKISDPKCAQALSGKMAEYFKGVSDDLNNSYAHAWLGGRDLNCEGVDDNFLKNATDPIFEGLCYTYKHGYANLEERKKIHKVENAYRRYQACQAAKYASGQVEDLYENKLELAKLEQMPPAETQPPPADIQPPEPKAKDSTVVTQPPPASGQQAKKSKAAKPPAPRPEPQPQPRPKPKKDFLDGFNW